MRKNSAAMATAKKAVAGAPRSKRNGGPGYKALVPVTVRLPRDLVEWLKGKAEREGRTLQGMVMVSLRSWAMRENKHERSLS